MIKNPPPPANSTTVCIIPILSRIIEFFGLMNSGINNMVEPFLFLSTTFRVWAIISLHTFLLFVALNNVYPVNILPTALSVIHLHKLIKQITHCFFLQFHHFVIRKLFDPRNPLFRHSSNPTLSELVGFNLYL